MLDTCNVCANQRKEVVATHWILPSKGGKWYLCNKHAETVRRTLLGRIYELQEMHVNDYSEANHEAH